MPSIAEASSYGSQLEAALKAGLRSIDRSQLVTFTQYSRTVLPADGYIFWLNTGTTMTVPGSLHYGVDLHQNEDETVAVNRVVFTSEQEVQQFNSISPGTLWIGHVDQSETFWPLVTEGGSDIDTEGGEELVLSGTSPILFAFSSRDLFYKQAEVYHYVGMAVQPPLLAQLIDNPSQLPTVAIVSDSLPAWLALQSYNPVWLAPANPNITLFPSFLVPDNILPPYGVVHIEPSQIRAIQGVPFWDQGTASHYQLSAEHVRVTLYGASNNVAADFLDLALQYARDTDAIGLMGMPIIRDEKRTQVELGILAQKKTIEFDVSYVQTRINDIALQLIASVPVTYYPDTSIIGSFQPLITEAGQDIVTDAGEQIATR